jgi:hypothetical protein
MWVVFPESAPDCHRPAFALSIPVTAVNPDDHDATEPTRRVHITKQSTLLTHSSTSFPVRSFGIRAELPCYDISGFRPGSRSGATMVNRYNHSGIAAIPILYPVLAATGATCAPSSATCSARCNDKKQTEWDKWES